MKLLALFAGGFLLAAGVAAAETVLVEEMRFERDAPARGSGRRGRRHRELSRRSPGPGRCARSAARAALDRGAGGDARGRREGGAARRGEAGARARGARGARHAGRRGAAAGARGSGDLRERGPVSGGVGRARERGLAPRAPARLRARGARALECGKRCARDRERGHGDSGARSGAGARRAGAARSAIASSRRSRPASRRGRRR